MKKKITLSILLITALSMTTGFVISRGTQNMHVRMSAKDLPEYGVTIVRPSDPDFDVLAAEQLKDVPAELVDRIKPLSVLIRNDNKRTVVAHAIIWDCMDSDGKSQRSKKLFANSEALTDASDDISEPQRPSSGKTISPGAAKLFSILNLPRGERTDGPGGGGSGGASYRQSGQSGGAQSGDTESLMHDSSIWLSKCVELVVSIDGVFFDDGAFVGPNQAGLFDQIQTQVEAKTELRKEIKERLDSGTPADEILKFVESKANADGPANLASIKSTEGYRAYFRKFFATIILQQSKAYGPDNVLKMALGPSGKGKPAPRLRKLKSPADLE